MKHPFAARRLPSLNALRVFEAAARHLSFKAAARELNVSQSAVSHQIKALEQTLEITLFARKPRAVELTRRGKLYYPILRNAFDSIAQATEMILDETSKSVMTIQVYSTFTIRWLLPRLEHFQERHDEIQIRLHTSQSNTDFRQDDVDAAILVGQPENPLLNYDHLFDSELFPVCSQGYLNKHGPIENPADLSRHPLLQVYPSADDWRNWLAAKGLKQINPDSSMHLQMESYNDALSSAAQGFGIALGQQPYMAHDINSGALLELFPGQRVRNPNAWYLACRSEKSHALKFKLFREWLLSEINADADLKIDSA
ncbi:MAG: transcriptional regulator GcvA [Gammaproteobacteria bacterium]|nr:transcriptional regulator GcvA [Gammaproteobacteria bacterium]